MENIYIWLIKLKYDWRHIWGLLFLLTCWIQTNISETSLEELVKNKTINTFALYVIRLPQEEYETVNNKAQKNEA